MTFGYRFLSEDVPTVPLRLKVEVNTREHLAVLDFNKRPFPVKSRWYSRAADTTTFELDELLATKMRALYQRRKGRDLFDLTMGLEDRRSDAGRITAAFREYMNRESGPVSRAMYERNLAGKIVVAQFNADMSALLRPGIRVATGGRCTDHVGTADPPPSGRTLEAGGGRRTDEQAPTCMTETKSMNKSASPLQMAAATAL